MSIVTLYAKTFSTPLLIALVAWPFISAFLTLPILALLYHRDHRLRLASVIGSYLIDTCGSRTRASLKMETHSLTLPPGHGKLLGKETVKRR